MIDEKESRVFSQMRSSFLHCPRSWKYVRPDSVNPFRILKEDEHELWFRFEAAKASSTLVTHAFGMQMLFEKKYISKPPSGNAAADSLEHWLMTTVPGDYE